MVNTAGAWPSPVIGCALQGYYINMGFLLPTFHKIYWIGLNTSAALWPRFSWTVRRVALTAVQHARRHLLHMGCGAAFALVWC
jgi:hypothetical protein